MDPNKNMTPLTWRKSGVFDGTIDPFSANGITSTCGNCGHLNLYQNGNQTTRPCTNCAVGTMSSHDRHPDPMKPPPPPLKPQLHYPNNNNWQSVPASVYNPANNKHHPIHTNTNTHPQSMPLSVQYIQPNANVPASVYNPANTNHHPIHKTPTKRKKKRSHKSKQLPPTKPQTQPSKPLVSISQAQPIFQSASKPAYSIQQNSAFESPPQVQQKRYSSKQKQNTNYQQRQQKFHSLMQRQYNCNGYNKPLPRHHANKTQNDTKRSNQPNYRNMKMMQSTPNLFQMKAQSSRNIAHKRPQKFIYNSHNHNHKNNNNNNRLKPHKPVLKSHSSMRLIRAPHANQKKYSMNSDPGNYSKPVLGRAQSDKPSLAQKPRPRIYTDYQGYPHRGPPIDIDKLLLQ